MLFTHFVNNITWSCSVIVWLFCWTQLLNIASVLSTSIRVSPDGSISLLFSVHGDPSFVCRIENHENICKTKLKIKLKKIMKKRTDNNICSSVSSKYINIIIKFQRKCPGFFLVTDSKMLLKIFLEKV